jgi:NAD(P)-dependent dehydrogenase (short-subunit alcohol dehydrogenase family)
MTDIALVIGVGASQGLGAAVARRFARGGLQVVVAGRTEERLSQVADEITEAGGTAFYCVTDATRPEDLENLLNYAGDKGRVTSVVFNVGNNRIVPFTELSAEQFEQFWRVCTLAGFLTAKAALPELERNGGSLLFTGASASMRGRPNFAHFGAAKAALRNLAQALAKDYGPRGVHVGHVVVDGVINGEVVRTHFGEYLDAMGEDGSMEPDAIAEAFWFLHTQPRNTWTFEVDVRPFKESW